MIARRVAIALLAAYVLALALGVKARSARGPDWRAVAQCETGGRWDWGARRRPLEGSEYEGGVGFAASTWRAWARELGILHRFPHAYLAPRAVQILVAQYGWEKGGYWGCLR